MNPETVTSPSPSKVGVKQEDKPANPEIVTSPSKVNAVLDAIRVQNETSFSMKEESAQVKKEPKKEATEGPMFVVSRVCDGMKE